MQLMKSALRTLAIIAICFSSPAHADDEYPVVGDDFVYCTVCHGAQLMGNAMIQAPRLSKMETWYVRRQLLSFKNGWRGTHSADEIGMEMQPMAAALSEKQIDDVTEFVAATTSEPATFTVEGDVSKGRTHYSTCSACHGENGEGNQSLGGPSLTIANDWYIVEQLEKYRDGSRGNHPQDSLGNQMRAAAQILDGDEAINDVVAYINTLRSQ